MADLRDLLKKYFLVVRSHDDQGVIAPYTASFYPKISLAYKEVNEIHINIDSPPDNDVFYDWRGSVYRDDDAGEPCFVVYVNERFAGLYLLRLRSLYATDWSHDWECVRLAREVIPRLISALGLKPLTRAEREKIYKTYKTLKSNPLRITVGGDPEFEMWRGSTLVSADDYLNMGGSIGTDGARSQVELRPAPGTPAQVVRNLRELIKEFARRFPKYDLDAAGHRYPCGGHIHIGGIPDREPPGELLELLDDFVGKPSLPLSGEARGEYRRLSAWEDKPWGFEYRTPPAAVFSNPRVARTVLKLARNLVTKFYSGRALEYNDPPGVEDYIRVGGLTEREAAYLVEFFRQGVPRSLRIRAAWGTFAPEEGLAISFRDDWLPERKRLFRKVLVKNLRRGEIVLYGLASSRGFVATIPGVPGAAVLDDPPYAPVNGQGRVWVGLPWRLRMEEGVDETLLREAAEVVARYCRQFFRVSRRAR